MRASQIAKELALRAENVAQYLMPGGKRRGNEWYVGSINGEPGGSLKICLTGDKAGIWCDFENGQQSGDLLNLWELKRNLSTAEAILEAKQWLGIASVNFVAYRSNKHVRPDPKKLPSRNDFQSSGNLAWKYLQEERKLNIATLEAFDIRTTAEKIIFPYWRSNELIQIKYLGVSRPNGKKQINVEANCEPCLFGWQALPPNTRIVVLTEGEIDAMSAQQCGIAALSVPYGGGSGEKHKWLEFEYDRLSMFDEIYLCFDQDEVGKETTQYLLDRLGRHRCRVVELPYKDLNECLQQGMTEEQIRHYFATAKILDPVELRSATSFTDQVVEAFYPVNGRQQGYTLPWPKTHEHVLLRPGELSIWTGTNGHGKSQLLGQVVLSAMQQGAKVCIASLEIRPDKVIMRLTRQTLAIAQPTVEEINTAMKWYEDKLWLFDLVGSTKTERLLEVFLYAHQRYGIDVFVIDSLMKCGMAEDDYNAHKLFVEQLCDFKHQYNCHIHLVAHPRKGMDEKQPPGKMDIKGTGAISDLADNCFSVWRNKSKEQKIQADLSEGNVIPDNLKRQFDCILICDKQRNGDWEGMFKLWFDGGSFQFLSEANKSPISFIY